MTTTAILNATTSVKSRIDTVLGSVDRELDWANDSGWQPGDPLYAHPWDSDSEDVQYVRSMIQLLHEDQGQFTMIVAFENDWDFGAVHWQPDCESCEVSWAGPGPCWVCGGSPAPDPVGFIRIPAGAEITAVEGPTTSSFEEHVFSGYGSRHPEIHRYYFDRPVTETRRPRRND